MAIYLRPALRQELRRRYDRLRAIPAHRWSTAEGQAFLGELVTYNERYGQGQLAEALGVSHQGVSRMLHRYEPEGATSTLRIQRALADLDAAYDGVRKWRALNRVVQRHYESWWRMHNAVATLQVLYPIPVIARLSGIRAQELHRFMEPPRPAASGATFDDVALMVLLEEYDGGRALDGPSRRSFLSLLEETLALHEVADVASVLRVKPALIRTWMVEKAHGQRSAEPTDR